MRRILLALAIGLIVIALPGVTFATSDEETVRLLKRDADQGNANAQGRLGYFYETGRGGLAKDDREAARLYRLAADQGNASARNNLGGLYRDGRGGLTKDDREALRLFKLAADQGNAYGQLNLGLFNRDGRGGLSKDDREAARLFKLAADQAQADARVNLGYFYETGHGGLAKDDGEAVRLYRLAADQGNATAQSNLGVFYRDGRGGLAKDDREALRLFKLAADQGNPYGQNHLGGFYRDGGGGLAKDDREAARLFKLAADQGHASAKVNLGYFYEKGRGDLAQDDREAARLYKLAADQGNAAGQNYLGVLYRDGRGGLTKDEREAARLFKLASDQNYAYAQQNLGTFYRDGRGGLTVDDREAARLLKLAADQGNANARTALNQITQQPSQEVNAAPNAHLKQEVVEPSSAPAANLPSVPERRVALVIGNSAYQTVSGLPNTTNDARAIAEVLKADGFTSVRIILDMTRASMIASLNDFQREADTSDWAVVYYAGHGLEVSGANYLVPIDAKLGDDRDIQDEAVSVDRILSAVENAKKLRLVMLDACRDNPFLKRMHRSIATRSISRGLAAIEPSGATLIVFAAKDGETAEDGTGGHSPFAASLIKRLQQPTIEINKLFRLVTSDVLKATGNQQRPFVYGSLPGEEDYYFRLR
jgi:TPR repeat protein